MNTQMDLTETIVGLGACAGLLVVAVVLDRRPCRPGKLNYIPLMNVCPAACLVLGRHLLTLIRPGVNRARVLGITATLRPASLPPPACVKIIGSSLKRLRSVARCPSPPDQVRGRLVWGTPCQGLSFDQSRP